MVASLRRKPLILGVLALLLLGLGLLWAAVAWTSSAPAPSRGNAVYQAHEHGFMVLAFTELDSAGSYHNPEECIYSILSDDYHPVYPPKYDWNNGYRYCVRLDEIYPQAALRRPFSEHFITSALKKLWSSPSMRTALGSAVGEPVFYHAEIPALLETYKLSGTYSFMPEITLPDGTGLYCGSRGGTSGYCLRHNRLVSE